MHNLHPSAFKSNPEYFHSGFLFFITFEGKCYTMNIQYKLIAILWLFCSRHTIAQTTLVLSEQTLKIVPGKTETISFGFLKDDMLRIVFEEDGGKEIKHIEIIEYPSNPIFSEYKVTSLDKTIKVNSTGVYMIKLTNESFTNRVCNIRVERVPENEAGMSFNSHVLWVTKQDTVWNSYTKDVLLRYDTVYKAVTKKELVSITKREEVLLEKRQVVHSQTNANGNKSWVMFKLPMNKVSELRTEKVVSWAYWVGVSDESNQTWQKNVQMMQKTVVDVASAYTTPLGGYAAGVLTTLLIPQTQENIKYVLLADVTNLNLMMSGQPYKYIDNGYGPGGFMRQLSNNLQGDFYIALVNDNVMLGLDVDVKVSAIIETTIYENKSYRDASLKPIYEKQIVRDPVIKTSIVPTLNNNIP